MITSKEFNFFSRFYSNLLIFALNCCCRISSADGFINLIFTEIYSQPVAIYYEAYNKPNDRSIWTQKIVIIEILLRESIIFVFVLHFNYIDRLRNSPVWWTYVHISETVTHILMHASFFLSENFFSFFYFFCYERCNYYFADSLIAAVVYYQLLL